MIGYVLISYRNSSYSVISSCVFSVHVESKNALAATPKQIHFVTLIVPSQEFSCHPLLLSYNSMWYVIRGT